VDAGDALLDHGHGGAGRSLLRPRKVTHFLLRSLITYAI
jgi:hypothetical protein